MSVSSQGLASEAPLRPPLAEARLEAFANLVITLLIALGITFVPVVAHGVHGTLGILLALLLAGACAWRLPQAALVAVVAGFFFQNLFVSLMADFVRTKDDFDIIRAYNFLVLCTVWLVLALRYLADWQDRARELDRYALVTFLLLAVIGFYFAVGFLFNGMTAVVYLRNIVTPLLFFQICVLVFASHDTRLGPPLSALGLIVLACGVFEFLWRDAWLTWTNGYSYWELAAGANWQDLAYDRAAREYGNVVTRLTDTFRIDFFNSPLTRDLGIEMMRLFGPNMHAISFAYGLSFLVLFALFRGRFVQAFLLFVLLFLCNAKGPLILLVFICASFVVFHLFGAGFAFALHGAVLVFYGLAGIVVGLDIGDFHVLGLMSAIYDFPFNPLGHLIGTGGNLSPAFNTINWYDAQHAGRTPFAVESSIGVLMYQMGVFAFAIVGAYVWFAWRVMRIAHLTGNALHAAASLGLMAMVANGLFQEEAFFSPLALALYLGLVGMILGAAVRSGLHREILS